MSYSPSGGGGGGNVGSAADVALSGPLDGQYLGYSTAIQKWQNFVRPPQLIESIFVNSASGSTEIINDVTTCTITLLTLSDDCTLTFPVAATGKSFTLILEQDGVGSRTVIWPSNVRWPGDTSPTLTTTPTKSDIFSFICVRGANWLGFVSGKSYSLG